MTSETSWSALTVSSAAGVLVGVVMTLWWKRRHRTSGFGRGRPISGSKGRKIKVYHRRTFRSARVAWLVAELGAEEDFDFVPYDPYTASEGDREWFKKSVHPHGTVPAMVDEGNGKVLLESAAICMYLAERYGKLLPLPDMMADYYDWCVYAVTMGDSCLKTIELEMDKKVDQDTKRLEAAFANADLFARRLDKHLAKRNFVCGSTFTVADVVVGYSVMWASVIPGRNIIDECPNLNEYLGRLKARWAFQKMGTLREWLDFYS